MGEGGVACVHTQGRAHAKRLSLLSRARAGGVSTKKKLDQAAPTVCRTELS